MKIQTKDLTGNALDWAVAKCLLPDGWPDAEIVLGAETDYSTDWAQGGPIIERENIALIPGGAWGAVKGLHSLTPTHFGPTPLIAALRCYVASQLGQEVDVPEELCGGAA